MVRKGGSGGRLVFFRFFLRIGRVCSKISCHRTGSGAMGRHLTLNCRKPDSGMIPNPVRKGVSGTDYPRVAGRGGTVVRVRATLFTPSHPSGLKWRRCHSQSCEVTVQYSTVQYSSQATLRPFLIWLDEVLYCTGRVLAPRTLMEGVG